MPKETDFVPKLVVKEDQTLVIQAHGGGAVSPNAPSSMTEGGGTGEMLIWTETDKGPVARPLTKEEAEARYRALKGEPESD